MNTILILLEQLGVLVKNKLHNQSIKMLTDTLICDIIDTTSFLHSSASIRDRILSIQINLLEQPVCQTCSTPVFPKLRNTKLIVPIYCSKSCVNNLTSRDKRINTIKEKYHVDHPLYIPEFVDKRTKTIQQQYGVDNIAQSPIIKEKTKQTNLTKYGVNNPQQNVNVKEKTKQTNLKKYGQTCSLLNYDVQQKSKTTNIEKFGTEFPIQNKTVSSRQKQTMKDLYGAEYYQQIHIPPETLELLNNKQFLEEQHLVKHLTQSQLADLLNVGKSVISRYFKKHNIHTKHFFKSTGEKQLADFVASLGLPIECNTRQIIHPLELDIYVPEIKLALEFNGTYWHSEQYGRGESYHNKKTVECLAQKILLLHVCEDVWKESRSLVEETIIRTVNQLKELPL